MIYVYRVSRSERVHDSTSRCAGYFVDVGEFVMAVPGEVLPQERRVDEAALSRARFAVMTEVGPLLPKERCACSFFYHGIVVRSLRTGHPLFVGLAGADAAGMTLPGAAGIAEDRAERRLFDRTPRVSGTVTAEA